MLEIRYELDGEEDIVPLTGSEIRLGRSGDNEVILPDYSVSRRHAVLRPVDGAWHVFDLKSTNGVQLNGEDVQKAAIQPGDVVKVGIFELHVEGSQEAVAPAREPTPASGPSPLSNATIIRSIDAFSAEYGLDESTSATTAEALAERESKRKALDEAYGTEIFGFLTRLARTLITADSVDMVLERVMAIAFDALPVDRGFILLSDETSGELVCEMVRLNDRVELRPQSEVPISKTMLQSVMRERVALMTYDALADQRLAGTESVRIHQIRAAMCAPLWSGGEKIIGVMQVDTPHHAGSFTPQDVDLLTTLANFCAVAIERVRNARRADMERQLRSRLERYHSPGVIEEVMHEEEGRRELKRAEASVLFADIVGFTAFSENAAPEVVAELMEIYFTHAVEAIFDHGGTLDKFIGDCVMAFFGAPMAQQDHAERAVAAAIRIQEALDEWNAERTSSGLDVIKIRVAINSGPVVVGDIGSNRRVDYTVLGNTVNVAARLEESVAKPGDIVLGEETRRLIAGKFKTEPLGAVQLKGLSQKIGAHRVVRGRSGG